MIDLLVEIINSTKPESEVRYVRGRICFIKRYASKVFGVSVIDGGGKFVGTRFITGWMNEKKVDAAVGSVLMTGSTY